MIWPDFIGPIGPIVVCVDGVDDLFLVKNPLFLCGMADFSVYL